MNARSTLKMWQTKVQHGHHPVLLGKFQSHLRSPELRLYWEVGCLQKDQGVCVGVVVLGLSLQRKWDKFNWTLPLQRLNWLVPPQECWCMGTFLYTLFYFSSSLSLFHSAPAQIKENLYLCGTQWGPLFVWWLQNEFLYQPPNSIYYKQRVQNSLFLTKLLLHPDIRSLVFGICFSNAVRHFFFQVGA